MYAVHAAQRRPAEDARSSVHQTGVLCLGLALLCTPAKPRLPASLDCSALSEHLEPLYLENLQRAIERLRQANGGGDKGRGSS